MTPTTAEGISPVIDGFLSCWPGDDRFRSLLPPVARTRATLRVEEKRTFKIMDWVVREFTPAWLSQVGSRSSQGSEVLGRLPEIESWESLARALPILMLASRFADESARPLLFDTSGPDKGTITDARDVLWGVTKPGTAWWYQSMWQGVPDRAEDKAFKDKAIKRYARVVWAAAQNAALETARTLRNGPDAWEQIRAAAEYAALHPKTYRYNDEVGGEVPDKDVDLTAVAPATQDAARTLGLLAAKNGARLAAAEAARVTVVEAFHGDVLTDLLNAMRAAASTVKDPEGAEGWAASMEAGSRLVESRWQGITAQLQEPAARLIGSLATLGE